MVRINAPHLIPSIKRPPLGGRLFETHHHRTPRTNQKCSTMEFGTEVCFISIKRSKKVNLRCTPSVITIKNMSKNQLLKNIQNKK